MKYMLKCAMYSALVNSIIAFCKDLVDYAIWLLLIAIFIKMNLGGKE